MGEGADAISTPRSSVLERIDQLCDRYEVARLAGQNPRIDDYLRHVPEAERSKLFRELLKPDLHYRRQQQETPTEAEYCQHFPEYSDLIHAIFRGEAALRERRSAHADSSLRVEGETGPELAEKRGKRQRKILLDAARAVFCVHRAGGAKGLSAPGSPLRKWMAPALLRTTLATSPAWGWTW
jgi:hypothetical protein